MKKTSSMPKINPVKPVSFSPSSGPYGFLDLKNTSYSIQKSKSATRAYFPAGGASPACKINCLRTNFLLILGVYIKTQVNRKTNQLGAMSKESTNWKIRTWK